MSPMEGLELLVIGRTKFFELTYENGRYYDPKGNEIEDLMDIACFKCGSPYYTLEGSEQIQFCPNCGAFDGLEFHTLPEFLRWARTQNWGFLQYSGKHAYAVHVGDEWILKFAPKDEDLYAKGYEEIHRIA